MGSFVGQRNFNTLPFPVKWERKTNYCMHTEFFDTIRKESDFTNFLCGNKMNLTGQIS